MVMAPLGAPVAQVINILIGLMIAIAVVYLIFDLLACVRLR